MEGDSTLRSHKNALARINAGVLPDTSEVQARYVIAESDVIPATMQEKAISKALALADKKDKTPKKAATDLLRAIEKKHD